jgi:acyl-CoA thioesterase-1
VTLARRFACLCAAVAVVLALACEREVTPTRPSASEPPRLVAVLGDSLSVSPSTNESFPAVLGRRLAAEWPGWTVLNSGVNGDTTSGGLARLNTVLGQRPRVLILALGANDGLRGVPTETIETQLASIIERSQAASVQVLLTGMETPPLHGLDYSIDFHRIYPELARRFDVSLVPFLLAGVVGDRDLNQSDLVHPNRDGARRIAENVWPYLVPLLSRATASPTSAASTDSG